MNWRLTLRVREAVREGRVLISEHARAKAWKLKLKTGELVELLRSGVVLTRRERDEAGTATDGYKHFLKSASAAGKLYEIVFKFVAARSYPGEELVVLITLYRGKV